MTNNKVTDKTMRLSELRPCDYCGGALTGKDGRCPVFHVVDRRLATIDPREANQVLGLTQYFQGALGLAEIMGPLSDPVKVSYVNETALVCNDCAIAKLPSAPEQNEADSATGEH